MKNNVVIHVPHSSLYIPKEYLADYDRHILEHELLVMTDRYCNELFDCGMDMVKLDVSRLVCDVERFRDDEDETMSKIGMGLYYTSSSKGEKLREFTTEKRKEIVSRYYDPHHSKLTNIVNKKLEELGSCLLIDGHSFYPVPLPYELDQATDRPDICIGTDEYHTPDRLVKLMMEYISSKGLSVKINSPFAGALVPIRYYGKERNVQAVMIEINRRLYMKENGEKNENFYEIKKILAELMKVMCKSVA